MLWDELDVEGSPVGSEIKRGLAGALGVKPEQIEIVDDAGAKAAPPGIEVRVETTRHRGEFPLRLGIYFVGTKPPPADRAKAQDAIARGLAYRILVSDGGPDPYRRVAIDSDGRRQVVDLDVGSLDERGELRLTSELSILTSSTGVEAKLDPARSLVVGRSPGRGLEVDDLRLSRRHFELRCVDGVWHVEDLHSTSGTYVNGLLARGPTALARGDRIRAGGTDFTLS